MLSIFVIYSVDRIEQFEIFYECLQEMPGYEDCQKILIVDDDQDICALLKRFLSRHDYEADACQRGEDCLGPHTRNPNAR